MSVFKTVSGLAKKRVLRDSRKEHIDKAIEHLNQAAKADQEAAQFEYGREYEWTEGYMQAISECCIQQLKFWSNVP